MRAQARFESTYIAHPPADADATGPLTRGVPSRSALLGFLAPEQEIIMVDQANGFRRFHHVGLRAIDPQPDENFVTATRVWVTDPNKHPQRIEFLRYEPDSYLDDRFKDTPHVAWVVDDIDPWIAGKEIAIAPFDVGDPAFVRVAFVWEEGMISEYMAFKPGAVWFDPDDAGKERVRGS